MPGPFGIDLDNTIVSYDEVLYRTAKAKGLLESPSNRGKKAIRDTIRCMPDGEVLWQKLQAEIYGPRMQEAELIDGVVPFFEKCCERAIKVYIVSHKTEFANYDSTGTSLRASAMEWLEAQGFFDSEVMGLTPEQVFFESTRSAKLERIERLGCTHFIDDLEETFLEQAFPKGVSGILFDRHGMHVRKPGLRICTTWAEITECLVDNRA